MVTYSATIKNEFLDCAGHRSLGLGVETHDSPSSFFQLVQKKTVLFTDGNGFSKEESKFHSDNTIYFTKLYVNQ